MKRVYELEVYKLAEELSDLIWNNFDKWNKIVIEKPGPKLNAFINSTKLK